MRGDENSPGLAMAALFQGVVRGVQRGQTG